MTKYYTNRIFFSVLSVFVLGLSLPSESQAPAKVKAQSREYREMMETWTRQLGKGVTCTTCHNVNNFSDSSKREFKIAQDHLKKVQILIDSGFDGKNGQPKADCYLCHQGQLIPRYKEVFDPLTMKNQKQPKMEVPANQEDTDPE